MEGSIRKNAEVTLKIIVQSQIFEMLISWKNQFAIDGYKVNRIYYRKD